MAYTLANLQDDVRNYTEVDSGVLSNTILDTKIKDKSDLVELNLKTSSSNQKEISIFSKKKTDQNIKILSNKEIEQKPPPWTDDPILQKFKLYFAVMDRHSGSRGRPVIRLTLTLLTFHSLSINLSVNGFNLFSPFISFITLSNLFL